LHPPAHASVLIDLTDAAFIDCQVIGWLVRWCEHGRRSANFRVCVATGDASVAKRLIDLLGLAELAPRRASRSGGPRNPDNGQGRNRDPRSFEAGSPGSARLAYRSGSVRGIAFNLTTGGTAFLSGAEAAPRGLAGCPTRPSRRAENGSGVVPR
jgi:hypothetical protein